MQIKKTMNTEQLKEYIIRSIVFVFLLWFYMHLVEKYGWERPMISLLIILVLNTNAIWKAVDKNARRDPQ